MMGGARPRLVGGAAAPVTVDARHLKLVTASRLGLRLGRLASCSSRGLTPAFPPPAPPDPPGAESDAWRTLRPYLRQWGDGALSATTLWNPEYRHMVAPGVGSVAYVIYKVGPAHGGRRVLVCIKGERGEGGVWCWVHARVWCICTHVQGPTLGSLRAGGMRRQPPQSGRAFLLALPLAQAYWRTVVLAVSDPLCAPADHEAMARAFLQVC